MFHVQRVGLNEFASWFNNIAHQFGEYVVGFGQIIDPEKRAETL